MTGFANGFAGAPVGHLAVDTYSAGLYWTHIGPGGWYADAVVMGGGVDAKPNSVDGMMVSTHGGTALVSFEAGLPLRLPMSTANTAWTIEPQTQLVYQHASINNFSDSASDVNLSPSNSGAARLGVRLAAAYPIGAARAQTWLRLNVLRTFGGNDMASFDGTSITTQVRATAGQVELGQWIKMGARLGMYANVGTIFNLGGARQRMILGNVGMRWTW
ncbi:Adhesin BmaC autotransporter [Pandoraea anapnoica]|uniref:Adhesin BmaC autotransporter n=1 Tax=Pandoraea anapnoica TaxID=2508301 RepID=A0A5E5APR5_9BURK|nr:Adhesin BmaC autotransporter [Pandoraea iniqua]VVE74997.1 Adhesin BmaC autotransporter [Pandoraea anapnoica]